MSGFGLSDDRLRQALTAVRGTPSTGDPCPDPGVLWDLASGGIDSGTARALGAHIVSCAACREAMRLAREAGATEGSPRVLRSSSTVRWAGWAAAAVLALGIVGVVLRERGGADLAEPEFRVEPSITISAETPRATARPGEAVALRWAPVPGATYDLTLARENLEVLAVVRGLERPEHVVPPATLSPLGPGEALIWQVEAVLANGRRVRSATFSVRVE